MTPKIPPPSFAFLRTEFVEVTEGRVVCRLEREADGALLVRATATNLLLDDETPPPA